MIDKILEIFHGNALFQGGFLLGVLTFIGAAFRNVPKNIYNFIRKHIVYTVNIPQTDFTYDCISAFFREHYADKYTIVETSTIDYKLNYKHLVDIFFIKYKGKYLKIHKQKQKIENANSFYNMFYDDYTISGIFAKKKINEFLMEAIEYTKQMNSMKTGINIYNFDITQNAFVFVNTKEIKPLDKIPLKNKQVLINDLDNWSKSKEWYLERAIPYKRGILFYGKAGNGKTTTALSLAKKYNRQVYVINLNGMTDNNLKTAFNGLANDTLVLIEDVDCAFDNREAKNKNIKFAFSTLLNCLDGVFAASNIITVFTTNHIEKLDSALIRAGRVDIKFEISNPDDKEIKDYIELFYNKKINIPIKCNNEISMCDVQNFCLNNKTNSFNN